jgi:hypothetical protein
VEESSLLPTGGAHYGLLIEYSASDQLWKRIGTSPVGNFRYLQGLQFRSWGASRDRETESL